MASCLAETCSAKDLEMKLRSSLDDTGSLSSEGVSIGAIPPEIRRTFDSLDPKVPLALKIRYLLLHAYEQVGDDPRRYKRWLDVLLAHGVPRDLINRIIVHDNIPAVEILSQSVDTAAIKSNFLSVKLVPILTDILAGNSNKWREIGMSLYLPSNFLDELTVLVHAESGVTRLNKVLREWIVGKHKHARPPTMENLKKALASNTTKLADEADKLQENLRAHGIHLGRRGSFLQKKSSIDVFPFETSHQSSKISRVDAPPLEIVHKSPTTEVAEEQCTLLEVQAVSKHESVISFQWMKDGHPLNDDDKFYLGTRKPVLCVKNATLSSNGAYTCELKLLTEFNHTVVVQSQPIPLAVSMSPAAMKLVGLYDNTCTQHRDSWPPVSKIAYINLALINQVSIDENADEFARHTIQGNMDDIENKKESIEYDEAFSEYDNGAYLLIEGRPGSGKTTLVNKVSRDWANGKPVLKGAKLVFLISLRFLSNKADKNILDILELFYQGEMARSISKHIDKTNGKGVCFIIDGLDEFPSGGNKDDSIIFKIVHRECLQQSMVIVASRPAATEELRHRADTRVEVLGFLKDQIFKYIENYPFKSVLDASQKLRAYLTKHPNIMHMCYLPVHAAMVSYLYDMKKEDLPHTETEIYKHFTVLTILRSLKRRNKRANLLSLENLSPNDRDFFMAICAVAFEMTVSSKPAFKQNEVSGLFNLW